MVKQSEKKKTVKELNVDVERLEKRLKALEDLINGVKALEDINVEELAKKMKNLDKQSNASKELKTLEKKVDQSEKKIDELVKRVDDKSNEKKVDSLKCKKCDKSFSDNSDLSKHVLVSHNKLKECKLCEQKFPLNVDLEVHLKTHEEKESFPCNKCDKVFVLKWRLKKHEEGHEQENAKFCHFFNNEKNCHFEEVGCMFRHEHSPQCRFQEHCANKLCQFKHDKKAKNNENDKVSSTNILDEDSEEVSENLNVDYFDESLKEFSKLSYIDCYYCGHDTSWIKFTEFDEHKSALNDHIHEYHEDYLQEYLEGMATFFGGKDEEDIFHAKYVEKYSKIESSEDMTNHTM